MDIKEASRKIYKIAKKNASTLGTELSPSLVFMHLTEEIGEIARQLINREHMSYRDFDNENLKEEIAQAILDLFVLSEVFEVDLDKELKKKTENIRKRGLSRK